MPSSASKKIVNEEFSTAPMADLSNKIGYQVRRAHAKSKSIFEALFSDFGIAPGQYGILKLISNNPNSIQKDIAQLAGIDATSIVPVVDKFEKNGWIRRRRDKADRRQIVLSMSKAGQEFLKRLDRRIRSHEQTLTRDLCEKERHLLIRLLSKITSIPVD